MEVHVMHFTIFGVCWQVEARNEGVFEAIQSHFCTLTRSLIPGIDLNLSKARLQALLMRWLAMMACLELWCPAAKTQPPSAAVVTVHIAHAGDEHHRAVSSMCRWACQ